MSKLVLMVGIAGSGKSTFAKKYFDESKDVYVSRDEIRFSMVAEDEEYFSKEKEVFNEYVRQVNKAIGEDHRYVYADATHLNKTSRDKLLSRLINKPDEIIAVYMKTPLFIAIERNNQRSGRAVVPEEVIKNMYKSIQLPTREENIDKLITITYKDKKVVEYQIRVL